jgi:hypothetical protein
MHARGLEHAEHHGLWDWQSEFSRETAILFRRRVVFTSRISRTREANTPRILPHTQGFALASCCQQRGLEGFCGVIFN